MTRLPVVLAGGDLPLAELHAARLDGEVYPLDDCFSPVDALERTTSRALVIRSSWDTRFIAEQRSAAWVWGAQPSPPRPHELCTGIQTRVRQPPPYEATVREVVVDEHDLTRVAGVWVTTPLRTVTDLARFSAVFDATEAVVVKALMTIGRFSLEECAVALDKHRNLPHKRQAWRRLVTVHTLVAELQAAISPS